MFKLNNVHNGTEMNVTVEHGGKILTFMVNTIVSKRKKEDLAPEIQFLLLNGYLDWKGNAFKDKLMDAYEQSEDEVFDSLTNKELSPLPLPIVHRILDVFDLDDVYIYLKDIALLKPPAILKDSFDPKVEEDARGSRVQTYIKSDYLELGALVLVLKATLPVIGQFAYFKSGLLGKQHKEYNLFNFLKSHEIYKSRPFVKLLGLVGKVFSTNARSEDENAVRVIERQIPKEELNTWLLAITTIQKVMIATLVDDTSAKNVVTKVYNFINNKLKVNGDVGSAIRAKKAMPDLDSGEGETESIFESYRIISDLPKGFVVEIEWALSDIESLMKALPVTINTKILADARVFTKPLRDIGLDPVQLTLLGWIMKDVIDPRALYYVKLSTIVDLLALAFAYLWELGFHYLAILITSSKRVIMEDVIFINTTTNHSRITDDLKKELDIYFPYKKVTVSAKENKYRNLAVAAIDNIGKEIYKQSFIATATKQYTKNIQHNTIPSDLKIQLATLVVRLNRKEK